MIRQRLILATILALVAGTCAAESRTDIEPCDIRITSYAAAAFNFLRLAAASGEIALGRNIESPQIVDAVFGWSNFMCRLSDTGFEDLVDIDIVFLDQDQIAALGTTGIGPRHYKFDDFTELDFNTYDVGAGTYRISILEMTGLRRAYADEGETFEAGVCSINIWVIDEDLDGEADWARLPGKGRYGVCN